MEPITVGIISVFILLLFMAMGFHIAVCMGLAGIISFVLLVGFQPAMHLSATQAFTVCSKYDFSVIPLFMLMGLVLYSSGIARNIYDAMYKWFGRLPGGMMIATIFSSAVFGAVNGSTIAAAVTFTKIGAPEMIRMKYNPGLACGSIAASGALSTLIPPSALMVMYAIIAEQSIGKCLMAGVLPGIISTLLYVGLVISIAIIKPELLPRGPSSTFRDKIITLKSTWEIPLLAIIVLGGLYTGIFTATEAAGIGAFVAILFGLFKKNEIKNTVMLKNALNSTISGTVMIFIILIGAFIFSSALAISQLPVYITELTINSGLSRIWILILIALMNIIMGTFMSTTAVLVITTPIVLPVIISLGYDPIWFGVITIKLCELGVLTPPVGLNVYAVKGAIGPSVSLEEIFKGVMPFLAIEILSLVLFIAFPWISLVVPNAMKV